MKTLRILTVAAVATALTACGGTDDKTSASQSASDPKEEAIEATPTQDQEIIEPEITEEPPAPEEAAPEEASDMTLEEYGVTYQCKYSRDHDIEFLNDFDLDATMADKDKMIEAWEIYWEEELREMFAPGSNNSAARSRFERFKSKLAPGGKDDESNPVGYVEFYGNSNSGEFSQSQVNRINSFWKKFSETRKAWKAGSGKL